MSDQTPLGYEFGPFRLSLAEHLLYHGREVVPLKPKVLDTLLLLVENSGRVMSKDELMGALWPDSFVEENSLTQNISLLRRALGGGTSGRQYVETIPKRGYRFVAEVRVLSAADLASRTREAALAAVPPHAPEEDCARQDAGARHVQTSVVEAARVDARAVEVLARDGVPARRRVLTFAVVLLLASTAAVAFLTLRRLSRPWRAASAASPRFREMHIASLTSLGKVWEAAISPDGKFVAYVAVEDGRQSVWVKQAESDDRLRIVPPAVMNCVGLTFSPDSNYVFYTAYLEGSNVGTLLQVPVIGGAQRQIITDVDSPVTFSPDGRRLAFMRRHISSGLIEHTLSIANADGTGQRRLSARSGADFYAPEGPAWSPDGRRLAVVAGTIRDDHVAGVYEVSVEDGSERPVSARNWKNAGRVAWLSDQTGLVVAAADAETEQFMQLWLVSYPGGEARRITKDLNHYQSVTLTAGSPKLVAVQADQIVSIWVSADGDPAHASELTLTAGGRLGEVPGLSWTPEGKIVYSSTTGGNTDIWIMEADGTNRRRLTHDPASDFLPTVSPDGRRIVFLSTRTGVQQLWGMDIDGRNQTQLTDGGMKYRPRYSPDGKWIVYAAIPPSQSRPTLWKMPAEGGQPVQLTAAYSRIPSVSPDGRLVACYYWDDRLSRMKLAIIPIEGGEPLKTFDPPRSSHHWSLQWSPDGRGLLYVQTQTDAASIWRIPLNGRPPEKVVHFPSSRILDFAWTADGRRFVCARAVANRDVVAITDFR